MIFTELTVKTNAKLELPYKLRKANLTHAQTYLHLQEEGTGVFIPIGNAEIML
jgi:hypothetical protein